MSSCQPLTYRRLHPTPSFGCTPFQPAREPAGANRAAFRRMASAAVVLLTSNKYLLQLARTRVVPIRERFGHRPSVVALADEFKHLFTASNHPIKVAWK